jgi:hypothetical protein
MAANTSHVSLFVSRELREALERSAREHGRSLSAEVRCASRAYTSDPSSAASTPSGASASKGREAP